MRAIANLSPCSPTVTGLPLLLDGPLSTTVIMVGVAGNLYCLMCLYRTAINVGMLVSLTALAIWDVILLLAAFGHHSLWATLHTMGFYPTPWDTYKVALDGLLECAHVTSTWMLLQVSATRFIAVSRPFTAARPKSGGQKITRVALGLVRMPLALTVIACLITIPCSFEFFLKPCLFHNERQFERQESGLVRNPFYFLFYRTLLLAVIKKFGPFSIIAILTVNTLRSMRQSMHCRASMLRQQGRGLISEVDKDKTKTLQTISTILLGKFLILRCWPTAVAVFGVLAGAEHSLHVARASEFMLLLNSATNSLVFVVLRAVFESRRMKRIHQRQRQLMMQHAEQVLSIGRMLVGEATISTVIS